MITITQNKIAGFEPRWAPFAGFSLLFDNPGGATSRSDGLEKISCTPMAHGELDLYFRLSTAVAEIGRDALITTFLFCPLPPSSYHITVWDGVNIDNVNTVHANLKAEWVDFVHSVPGGLERCPRTMNVVTKSDLVNAPCGAIAFRFEKLTIWGDQALVARLSPADESSSELLRKLSDARNNLGNEAKRELGIGTTSSYSPHVSLGYFANREHGRLARSHLLEWTDTVRESVKNSSIAVSSLSVYAFTDMASFYKRATTSPTSNGAGNGE